MPRLASFALALGALLLSACGSNKPQALPPVDMREILPGSVAAAGAPAAPATPDTLPAVAGAGAGAGATAGLQVNPAAAPVAPPPIAPPAAPAQLEATGAGSKDFALSLSKPREPGASPDASQELTLSLSDSKQTAAAPAETGAAPAAATPRDEAGMAAQLYRHGCRFRGARAAGATLGRHPAGGRRGSHSPSGGAARGGARHRADDRAHRRRQGRGHRRGGGPDADRRELPGRARPGAGMAEPAAHLRSARREAPLARPSRSERPPGFGAGARPGRRAERAAQGLCRQKPGAAGCHRRRATFRCAARHSAAGRAQHARGAAQGPERRQVVPACVQRLAQRGVAARAVGHRRGAARRSRAR